MEEEEFWENELLIEQESERQLRQQLAELQGRVHDCEAQLLEYLTHIRVSFPIASFLTPPDLQTSRKLSVFFFFCPITISQNKLRSFEE